MSGSEDRDRTMQAILVFVAGCWVLVVIGFAAGLAAARLLS